VVLNNFAYVCYTSVCYGIQARLADSTSLLAYGSNTD